MKFSEEIEKREIFYKMGVMCGNTLYFIFKFNNFNEMIKEANRINNKYKSDMFFCTFVIQAFKDNSYDYEKSCFYQEKIYVNRIEDTAEAIAEKILKSLDNLN